MTIGLDVDIRRVGRPAWVGPQPGETPREAQQRRHTNHLVQGEWDLAAYAKCARCGMARINVVHELDPETSIEGPSYFADFRDELHPFEPKP